MMNSICKTACALAVLVTASSMTMATDSVDLTVTGTITPAACTMSLTSSAINYGNIAASELTAAAYHDLGVKSTDLSVMCDAPVKFAMKAMSGRLGSVVSDSPEGANGFAPAPLNLFGAANVPAAGLGLDGSIKIGGFAARLTNVEADATVVDMIESIDDGINWNASTTAYITANDQTLSWAASGTIVPIYATTVTATLEVNAYLNKPEELDLTKDTNLDGLTTIELVYP